MCLVFLGSRYLLVSGLRGTQQLPRQISSEGWPGLQVRLGDYFEIQPRRQKWLQGADCVRILCSLEPLVAGPEVWPNAPQPSMWVHSEHHTALALVRLGQDQRLLVRQSPRDP